MSRRRSGWGVCLAGLPLVAAAACAAAPSAGSGADALAAASSSGTTTTASAAPGMPVWAQEFTACMRSHGEPDFPDITVTSNGSIYLTTVKPDFDPISPVYRKAFSACRHFLPNSERLPQVPSPPTPGVTCPSSCLAPPSLPTTTPSLKLPSPRVPMPTPPS